MYSEESDLTPPAKRQKTANSEPETSSSDSVSHENHSTDQVE